MKYHLTAISILIAGFAYGEELPPDSQELLNKLAIYEQQEMDAAKERIGKKRAGVASVLEQHMAQETKKGNLDVALVLRKKIAELKSLDSSPNEESQKKAEPESIIGTKWELKYDDEEIEMEFLSDTKLKWGVTEVFWKFSDDGAIEFAVAEGRVGQSNRLELDFEAKTGTFVNRNNNTETEVRLRSRR